MSKNNAAIYLRVSTDEQTVDNQRPDLQRVAEARGLVMANRLAKEQRKARAGTTKQAERVTKDARLRASISANTLAAPQRVVESEPAESEPTGRPST